MTLPEHRLAAGSRVLIVEDDPLVAMELEETLHGLGCEVIGPCGRLGEALDAVEVALDGAIVDLNLRGDYTFQVLDRLRERGVPAVVCSGYLGLPEMQAHLSGLPVLSKPCSPEKVVSAVAEAVAIERGSGEAAS